MFLSQRNGKRARKHQLLRIETMWRECNLRFERKPRTHPYLQPEWILTSAKKKGASKGPWQMCRTLCVKYAHSITILKSHIGKLPTKPNSTLRTRALMLQLTSSIEYMVIVSHKKIFMKCHKPWFDLNAHTFHRPCHHYGIARCKTNKSGKSGAQKGCESDTLFLTWELYFGT